MLFLSVRFRLLHISYPEEHLDGYEGSIVREKRYKILTNAMPNHKIMNEDELLTVLGNQDDMAIYPMFNDNDTAKVNTINLGECIVNIRFYLVLTEYRL